MLESLIMLLGCIVGFLLTKKCPRALQKNFAAVNNKLQLACVALIIFIMGVNLGGMDDFIAKMMAMGGKSFVFAIVPTALSAFLAYVLSRRFIIRNK